MKDPVKILFITQEITPYLPENELATICRELPQYVQEQGCEIRIFMPCYGHINERRNQLHEVQRLSGMNLIIDDCDHPLIIKVASIQSARMQVYFIDNDDYFKRKATFTDEEGSMYPDNDERAIFFAKGVIETVKKLNWVPDIIHVHGWMASVLPVYLKHFYKDEALFSDTKIVISVYGQSFDGTLNNEMINKIAFDNIPLEAIKELETPTYENIIKSAINNSDAVIVASSSILSSLTNFIESSDKPFLPFAPKEQFANAYTEFYKKMLS